VTVAVGLLLSRNDRSRGALAAAPRRRDRFTLLEDEAAGAGLRRIALGQLELAIELLRGAGDGVSQERAVHDVRKAIKRLRALLDLIEPVLGGQAVAREQAVLRGIARRLAGARESGAQLATLDALVERHPGKLGGLAVVERLRRELLQERDLATAAVLGNGPAAAAVVAELESARARISGWRLADGEAMAALEGGLRTTYGDGRRRLRRLDGGHAGGLGARHRWRKRVKQLRYGAELLGIDGLAGRADELAEALGEERDLTLLARRVAAGKAPGGGRERARLLKRVRRRRRKLRRAAMAGGRRLYRRGPKKLLKDHRRRQARRASQGL
jgi:CHAD domain-containing protein